MLCDENSMKRCNWAAKRVQTINYDIFHPKLSNLSIIDRPNSGTDAVSVTGESALPCCHLLSGSGTKGEVGRFRSMF